VYGGTHGSLYVGLHIHWEEAGKVMCGLLWYTRGERREGREK
jgi:hypothetical protein